MYKWWGNGCLSSAFVIVIYRSCVSANPIIIMSLVFLICVMYENMITNCRPCHVCILMVQQCTLIFDNLVLLKRTWIVLMWRLLLYGIIFMLCSKWKCQKGGVFVTYSDIILNWYSCVWFSVWLFNLFSYSNAV